MSDAISAQVAEIQESSYGSNPTPAAMQLLRLKSFNMAQKTSTKVSDELRSDGQTVDVVRTGIGLEGDMGFEMSYGAHDERIRRVLRSASWAAEITKTGTVYSMAAGDNSLNRSSGDFVADAYTVGAWIKTSGFATAANNGFFKIVSIATTKIVLSNGTVSTEAAGPSVTIRQGAMITNGTTLESVALEQKMTDLASEFAIFNGVCYTGFNLDVNDQNLLMGTIKMTGKKETSAAATIGTSYTTAPTGAILNAIDHVTAIFENGSSAAAKLTGLSIAAPTRGRTQIASLGAASMGKNRFQMGGSFEAYYASKTIYDRYLNFTQTSITFILTDSAGKSYVFDFPAIKFTDGSRIIAGVDTDIMAKMAWTAFMHATEGIMCRVQRWP